MNEKKINLLLCGPKSKTKDKKRGAAIVIATISFCRHIRRKIKHRETQQ